MFIMILDFSQYFLNAEYICVHVYSIILDLCFIVNNFPFNFGVSEAGHEGLA